jgi:RNA polymerase I-specific transcription initiation factor RRN7
MGFSSTSEGNSDTDGTGVKSFGSRRSRKSAVEEERLPKLIETLGLCYLGILLLRLPTSLGEVYKWAAKEEIICIRAVSMAFVHVSIYPRDADRIYRLRRFQKR